MHCEENDKVPELLEKQFDLVRHLSVNRRSSVPVGFQMDITIMLLTTMTTCTECARCTLKKEIGVGIGCWKRYGQPVYYTYDDRRL